MSNPAHGGRYEIGEDGEATLVERTNWTPDADEPAEEEVNTDTDEDTDYVFP